MFAREDIKFKIVNLVIVLLVVFVPTEVAFSESQASPMLSVPFQVSLNPGNVVQANYAFDSHGIIFCSTSIAYTTSQIQWPYNGQTQSANLPIFLKNNPIFEGSFADPSGVITITNNTNTQVTANCLFAY